MDLTQSSKHDHNIDLVQSVVQWRESVLENENCVVLGRIRRGGGVMGDCRVEEGQDEWCVFECVRKEM